MNSHRSPQFPTTQQSIQTSSDQRTWLAVLSYEPKSSKQLVNLYINGCRARAGGAHASSKVFGDKQPIQPNRQNHPQKLSSNYGGDVQDVVKKHLRLQHSPGIISSEKRTTESPYTFCNRYLDSPKLVLGLFFEE